MNDMVLLLRLGFEVLIALLVLGTAIFAFLHARRGEDVASITFGFSCLALFVSQVVLISIITRTGLPSSLPSNYVLVYLLWYLAANYLLFGLGTFASIFMNGKIYVTIAVPVIVLLAILLGIGFAEGMIPGLSRFESNGSWLWAISGVMFFASFLMYLLFWIQRKDPYRAKMSAAFLLLSICLFLLMNVQTGTWMWYVAQSLRLLGFAVIFFEVQTSYA